MVFARLFDGFEAKTRRKWEVLASFGRQAVSSSVLFKTLPWPESNIS